MAEVMGQQARRNCRRRVNGSLEDRFTRGFERRCRNGRYCQVMWKREASQQVGAVRVRYSSHLGHVGHEGLSQLGGHCMFEHQAANVCNESVLARSAPYLGAVGSARDVSRRLSD